MKMIYGDIPAKVSKTLYPTKAKKWIKCADDAIYYTLEQLI